MLERKEAEANKIARDMEELKQEYADIYAIVKHIESEEAEGRLSFKIRQLRSSGK